MGLNYIVWSIIENRLNFSTVRAAVSEPAGIETSPKQPRELDV